MEIKRDKSLDLKPDRERKKVRGENKKERITICDFQSSWWIFKPLGERVIFFVEGGRENGSSRNDFSVAGKELRVLFNFVVLCVC